jgi:hypothetical protein
MDSESQATTARVARKVARTLRLQDERERLVGHSSCLERHRHYRAGCCPRCTELWGDLPNNAPSIPWEAISDHRRANYSEETWALVARVEADLDEYQANWTSDNCRHEICAITADNREICARCDRDVTEPDFPVEQAEIARSRLADYEARQAANEDHQG